MKKVFFVLFASAAFSFTACTPGNNKTTTTDSSDVNKMMNEAKDSVRSMGGNTADTANKMMNNMADSAKSK